VFSVGAKQVERAETSDTSDDCTPRACMDGEGAQTEGRLHGDEQVPE